MLPKKLSFRLNFVFYSLYLGCFVLFCVIYATATASPIYPNSVVSNDLEFISTEDPSAFLCIGYQGQQRTEMPDRRKDELFDDKTYIFIANYTDGVSVDLWVHSDFSSQESALVSAKSVGEAIGKLPTIMRTKLDHVVIHNGDEVAFGEADGHFFVLYSDNIQTRIRNHDLEETIFHESVHATLDSQYLNARNWREAQRADGAFITDYAAKLPEKEDLAESALFAWTMLVHPGRLPASVEQRARDIMPNRLAFFDDLFLSKPIFYNVAKEQEC